MGNVNVQEIRRRVRERESAIGVQSVNKSPNLAGQYLDKSSRSILTLHFSIEFPKHVLHALLNVVSLIFSIKSLNGWFWFESWWHMYLITGVRALVFIWPQEGFCLNLFTFSPEYINWLWESLLGEGYVEVLLQVNSTVHISSVSIWLPLQSLVSIECICGIFVAIVVPVVVASTPMGCYQALLHVQIVSWTWYIYNDANITLTGLKHRLAMIYLINKLICCKKIFL